jgi:hypothetical protein
MADEKDRYTKVLDSFLNIVRSELALIDLDAKLKKDKENLSETDQLNFANSEKEALFKLLRKDIEKMIGKLAESRHSGWKRTWTARAQKLEDHAAKLRAADARDAAGGGLESLSGGGGEKTVRCPPGFELVEGVCMPI